MLCSVAFPIIWFSNKSSLYFFQYYHGFIWINTQVRFVPLITDGVDYLLEWCGNIFSLNSLKNIAILSTYVYISTWSPSMIGRRSLTINDHNGGYKIPYSRHPLFDLNNSRRLLCRSIIPSLFISKTTSVQRFVL